MKNLSRFTLVCVAVFLAGISIAEARKKTAKEKAIDKCEVTHLNCLAKCDDLIDINNQVRDCNNKCDVGKSRCLLKAGVLEQTPGGTGSEQSPGALETQ